MKRGRVLIVACAALAGLCTPGCKDEDKTVLTVFHAGSLTVPLKEVSREFMALHPEIEVRAEAAGSRDCARKIRDLGRRCDVMASADYTVVDELLMPDHAEFNIRFATNEMAIAYTNDSARAGEITQDNWHEILLADGVSFGRADPNRDPCGYRTVMVMQLAERHLKIAGLSEKLRTKNGKRFIRPKETDLLALLEAGEIDYLFIYRSVASQHGLKTLLLPDEINLKDPARAAAYAAAAVKISGKTPESPPIVKRGKPMVYSVTIPKDAAHRAAAEAYVAFLLSDAGKAIMERNGQPSPRPARTDGYDKLPPTLRPYCRRNGSPTRNGALSLLFVCRTERRTQLATEVASPYVAHRGGQRLTTPQAHARSSSLGALSSDETALPQRRIGTGHFCDQFGAHRAPQDHVMRPIRITTYMKPADHCTSVKPYCRQ